MKKYAILLSINDKYAFLAYCLVRSIKENAPRVFFNSDIIIYTDDLSEINKHILLNLTKNIIFKKIYNPFDNLLLKHPNITKWGLYILQKLHAFSLLHDTQYEKIIFLDVDMYVQKDFYDVLNKTDFDISFRSVTWNGKESYPDLLLSPDDKPPMLNGGFIIFNKLLNNYQITLDTIKLLSNKLFANRQDVGRGGVRKNSYPILLTVLI